jgi:hypothetical protein
VADQPPQEVTPSPPVHPNRDESRGEIHHPDSHGQFAALHNKRPTRHVHEKCRKVTTYQYYSEEYQRTPYITIDMGSIVLLAAYGITSGVKEIKKRRRDRKAKKAGLVANQDSTGVDLIGRSQGTTITIKENQNACARAEMMYKY